MDCVGTYSSEWRSVLTEWQGQIHESPAVDGQIVNLHAPILHLTHRSTRQNLLKSADWTPIEAQLLFDAGQPPITFGTLMRKGVMEFWRRAWIKKGYRDGMAGMVEAVVQALNRIMVYIQVWELQQQPSLPERYQIHEQKISNQWRLFKF